MGDQVAQLRFTSSLQMKFININCDQHGNQTEIIRPDLNTQFQSFTDIYYIGPDIIPNIIPDIWAVMICTSNLHA